jgi:4-amino-4-deoxy-L-arabinose transferase-like glycosyltransferase
MAVVWLALLLAALLARWAGRWFGSGAALVVLLLFTFDPNILAHGALATTDMGTAVFITLAAYGVWRYWTIADAGQVTGWRRYALVGAAIGLALASKFSGVILLPALALIVLWRLLTGVERRGWKRPLLELAGWVGVGTAVFLLIYRFDWAALQMDFALQQAHQFEGHSSFLLGQANIGGWWYYFPVLFAVKTPLPLLVLLPAALVLFARQRRWGQGWLWLLVGGFAAASLISRVNIGYRYLLPILPLLFVLMGALWGGRGRWRWLLVVGLLWLAVESLWLHPHYLAYFNQIAGGPANGWRVAVDSNLDWGQDLGALAAYERSYLPQPYQAAWLGTAPLAVYGIERGQAMSIWPQGREEPLSDPFYPPLPAPGQYVISATQLQGVYLKNQARFAWFRAQPPRDRIGYSLFVYDVAATGPAVGLGLSGIGPSLIVPADYAAFQTNDVRPRWFDARTSFLWPGGGTDEAWTAVGDGHLPVHPLLTQFYSPDGATISGAQEAEGRLWQYGLYEWGDSPFAKMAGITAVSADPLSFLGYQLAPAAGAVEMVSIWRVAQTPPAELKIFVHLLDANGELVAQHDGLDVAWRTMQPGDEFAQLHTILLPPDLPPGEYTLSIGLYRPEDGVRLFAQVLEVIDVP